MSVKYTYSISNDTLNGIVDGGALTEEIQLSTITIALDYINTATDVLDIWFKAAISGAEQTTLSGVVAAHTGEPLVDASSVRLVDESLDSVTEVDDDRRLKVNIEYEDHDHDEYATVSGVTVISGSLQDQIDNHTHIEIDITDLDKYTQAEVDALIATVSGNLDEHNEMKNIQGGAPDDYYHLTNTQYTDLTDGGFTTLHQHDDDDDHDHDDDYATISGVTAVSGSLQSQIDNHTHIEIDITDLDKYTQAEVDALIASASGTTDHSLLDADSLTYSGSGHTGFAPEIHDHDDLYYTKDEVDDLIASVSGTIVSGTLPCIQIRRTTDYTFGTTWEDITCDATDIEPTPDVLEHDDSNTDRINVKEDGYYKITYTMAIEPTNSAEFKARFRKNDATVINGSIMQVEDSNDKDELSNDFIAHLVDGDFVNLQLDANCDPGDGYARADVVITMIKLQGSKGEDGVDGADGSQGPPGSGSTINVYDDGVSVSGSPFESLNFVNSTVSGSATISGAADITLVGDSSSSTYANSCTLIIDSDLVDSTLTNFPVRLHIGTGSGKNSADTTEIFDELGANSKRLSVLDDNGTELYVEIEKWDHTGKEAELWVKVPSISSSSDTYIYLWYDSTAPNNTSYVGEPGDAVSQNVWNNNYAAVFHLSESGDGTTDEFKDSTQNDNDGTGGNGSSAETPTQVGGVIANAQNFDGINDFISMGNVLSHGKNDPMTYSAWIKTSGASMQVAGKANQTSWRGVWLYIESDGTFCLYLYDSSSNEMSKCSSAPFNDNQWHHVAATYDGSNDRSGITLYADGSELSVGYSANQTLGTVSNSNPFNIGAVNNGALEEFDGDIDEVRISDIDTSAAWVKTDYNSQNDSLITWQGFPRVSGSEHAELEDLNQKSTTSTDWQQAKLLQAPNPPAGKYRLGWYCEIRSSSISYTVYAKVCSNVEDSNAVDHNEVAIEPQNSDNWYPFSGFVYRTITGSPSEMDMELWYKMQSSSATAYIRNIRLEIWRVS